MKALILSLLIVSTSAFAATPKLEFAPIITAKSNHAFPVTTIDLTAEVACFQNVLGTISDIESNGDAVIGVVVTSQQNLGGPVCMGLSQQKFKVKISAPLIRQIRLLGGDGVVIR